MIELAENLLEILVVGICFTTASVGASRNRKKGWTLLSLVYASYFLGDLYWALYLYFYHKTPPVFYVSEMSWCAAYLFMILLLRHYQTDTERRTRHPVLWLIPLFVTLMTAFFMTRGSYILNLIDGVMMGSLMYRSVQGLLFLRTSDDGRKDFYFTVLVFCLIEYGLWISSCFWMDVTIRNPYFWFGAMLIIVLPLFIRTLRKADGK